jgi:PKD repeat protein
VLQGYAEFTVGSAMGVVITANKNEAFTGEKIQFSAQITNAVGNVNMIWNMDDSTEKYTSSFEHSYNSPRTYNIVLIVTDQGGNQVIKSKQVKIIPQYTLKIKVVDNKTSEVIDDALVSLGSDNNE